MGAPRRRRSRDPVKPPRGYHLDPPTPGLAPSGEPGLEDRLGTTRDHVQKPGRTTAVAHGSQVNDDGDIAVAPPGVAPHVLVNSESLHPLESVGRLVEDLLGSGQDCVVGGVPGDPQSGCHPRDRHALQDKGTQPPLHRRARQPRPGLSQAARVLPPHSTAVGAGEAPHAHHQLRGPPPHRHVGQAPGHRPTGYSLGAAGSAEGVLKPDRHAALDHRALGCEVLAHRGQSQGSQPQEGRQIRAGEGSLRHVEVSRDGCVAAPIIGRPRPLPTATTHPHLCTSIGSGYYTLKREEPSMRCSQMALARLAASTSKA